MVDHNRIVKTLLLVNKSGTYGVVNTANKAKIPFKFSQIQFWNQNQALVETKSGDWTFYNFSAEDKAADKLSCL